VVTFPGVSFSLFREREIFCFFKKEPVDRIVENPLTCRS
jgi:hypothetical protein